MAINTYLSIITLNINGLNALIKRHRIVEWRRKQDHIHMQSSRNPPQNNSHTQTTFKRLEKYTSCKWKYYFHLVIVYFQMEV